MGASNKFSAVLVALMMSGLAFPGTNSFVVAINDSSTVTGGVWSQWSEFGLCSVSCGFGFQSRNRICMNSRAINGNGSCYGDVSECQQCNPGPCPVNGGWTQWSDYVACSVSCGGGSQYRTRDCANPIPYNGGSNCTGNNFETATCNKQSCPVNGGWSEWSCYSICSKTCGSGTQHRNRSCDNPSPFFGGVNCVGKTTVERLCNEQPCIEEGGSRSCSDLSKSFDHSGVYDIAPTENSTFKVWCNMENNTGWTVVQRRIDGSVDFYRGWDDYKDGFGNLSGEYWIGLDRLHLLTLSPKKLRVKLEAWDGEWRYAEYSSFSVENEAKKYLLKISGYSGTAGDSFINTSIISRMHNNMFFSTKDRDNDSWESSSCALTWKSAWWHNSCFQSNLNGKYFDGGAVPSGEYGMVWFTWKGWNYGYKKAIIEVASV